MKNENRDLFGSDTAGYNDLQIKQMLWCWAAVPISGSMNPASMGGS